MPERFLCPRMRLLMAAMALGFLSLGARAAEQDTAPKVVKLPQLIDAIKQQKGKVVVVDFWADTWLICKKEFPHLVEMRKKHGKEGLVAMSVNLDDPKDEKVMKNVRDFLKEVKAEFSNFVLDEAQEVWQDKLKIVGAPVVFVFGRDGTVAKKYDEGVDYEEIEKLAVDLLKKK